MNANSMELAWIVVKDLKQAVKFYTETVGLKLDVLDETYMWAELHGHQGGARLGIAQAKQDDGLQPGQNAYVTFTVDDIVIALEEMVKKGAKCVGDIVEVPDHVKMQTMVDPDGNHFQMVQKLF